MLPEKGVVGDGCLILVLVTNEVCALLTLLGSKESQLIRRTRLVGIALSIIPILENDT